MSGYHPLSVVRQRAAMARLRRWPIAFALSALVLLANVRSSQAQLPLVGQPALNESRAPGSTDNRSSFRRPTSRYASRQNAPYDSVRPRYDMAQRPTSGPTPAPAPMNRAAPHASEYIDTPTPDGGGSAAGQYEFETGGQAYQGGQMYQDGGGYVEGPYDGQFADGGYMQGYDDGYGYGGGCNDGCCDQCNSGCGWGHNCGWHNLYVRADYLLWWGKGFGAPPLVTTSVDGTPRADAGVLGLPGTSVLSPSGNFADTALSGGRIRVGYWLDPCDTSAVEATYFGFGESNTNFAASSGQFPILARPFVNIEEDQVGNDAELVAYPNFFSGNIQVSGSSRLQGIDVIFRHAICRGCDWRVDWLAGWRYNRLDESLLISDDKEVLSSQTGLAVGTTLAEWDRFSTRNTFNGVQLGIIGEKRCCRWWMEGRGTLALGNNHASVNIDGQTTTTVPVPGGTTETVTTQSGLLAQSTNIGTYTNDDFAVVPQLGVNVGYEIVCGLWATVGYNFMYWSRVARPGDQIDTDVNLSQLGPDGLVGLPRPAYKDIISDYWAQGLNFGLAYRY